MGCGSPEPNNDEVMKELSEIKAELKFIKSSVLAIGTGSPLPTPVPVAKSENTDEQPGKASPPAQAAVPQALKTYSGKAGTTLEKVLLRKTSGAGSLKPTEHLINLTVDPPIIEGEGRKITVKYTFEVLDDLRAMFYCARTSRRYYQRMSQGWWLRLSDGTRVQARRAADRTAKRGKVSKPTKCVFKLAEDVDLALTQKMDLIYVPSADMPGWPKDSSNRSAPQIVINLAP